MHFKLDAYQKGVLSLASHVCGSQSSPKTVSLLFIFFLLLLTKVSQLPVCVHSKSKPNNLFCLQKKAD